MNRRESLLAMLLAPFVRLPKPVEPDRIILHGCKVREVKSFGYVDVDGRKYLMGKGGWLSVSEVRRWEQA